MILSAEIEIKDYPAALKCDRCAVSICINTGGGGGGGGGVGASEGGGIVIVSRWREIPVLMSVLRSPAYSLRALSRQRSDDVALRGSSVNRSQRSQETYPPDPSPTTL